MSQAVGTRANPAPGRAGQRSAAQPEPTLPRSGDVLEIGREASVQFAGSMLFRVIRVLDWPTYAGWVWLDGYQLNDSGEAVERRSIFVRRTGLQFAPSSRKPRAPRRNPA